MIPNVLNWLVDMIIQSQIKRYRGFYTEDQIKVRFRLLKQEDAPLLVDFYEKLSEETRYLRFQFHTESLTPEKIQEYAQKLSTIDPEREFAILAVICIDKKEQVVGVIRYAKENVGDREAEFAITIRDDFQKKKVGSKLLRLLVREAQEQDIDFLVGTIVSTNGGIVKLLKKISNKVKISHEGGQSIVRVDVRKK